MCIHDIIESYVLIIVVYIEKTSYNYSYKDAKSRSYYMCKRSISPTVIPYQEYMKWKEDIPYYHNIDKEGIRVA